MMQEFDALVKKRSELVAWWEMRNQIAAYDKKTHSLTTRFAPHPGALNFCGQQYAGAKNYHESPAWFVTCFLEEVERRKYEIAGAAVERALNDINEKILKMSSAIMAELTANVKR